jgi:hypothetical protein
MTEQFTLQWDSNDVDNGSVTITAEALDAQNNVIGSADREFAVTNTGWVPDTLITGIEQTSHEDTGLTPGALYRYRLRAASGEIVSEWTDWQEAEAASVAIDTEIEHGILLGHEADATARIDTESQHGIVLGHAATAQVGEAISATVEHGLILGHGADATVTGWVHETIITGIEQTFNEDTGLTTNTLYRYRVRSAVGENVSEWSVWDEAETTAALFAEIEHGITLGHSADAQATVDAEANHGIVLGHAAEITASIEVSAEHGITLGHTAGVELSNSAEATHGITLGHAGYASVGDEVTANITHGLVLGHAAEGDVGALPVDVEVSHGISLGHSATVDASIDTTITHGIILGHNTTASIGDNITASINHGLTLGQNVTAEATVQAEAAHGLTLGHGAVITVTQPVSTEIEHGIVLGHAVTASILMPVDATVTHGVVLGHSATVDVEITFFPPTTPLHVPPGLRSQVDRLPGPVSRVTVPRGPKSRIGG